MCATSALWEVLVMLCTKFEFVLSKLFVGPSSFLRLLARFASVKSLFCFNVWSVFARIVWCSYLVCSVSDELSLPDYKLLFRLNGKGESQE
jgi:hypothetical protein